MKNVQVINSIHIRIVKYNALFSEMIPAGISLIAVRGFFASNQNSRPWFRG